jgi:hypothetical protein
VEKFKLTSFQTAELQNLFSEIPKQEFNKFMDCLKVYLESGHLDNNIKGDSANRQVHIKKQAALLRDIALQSQKLKILISGLDKEYIESIDCEVGSEYFSKIRDKEEVVEVVEVIKKIHQITPQNEQHITNHFSRYLKEVKNENPGNKFEALLDYCEDTLFEACLGIRTTDNLDVWINESIHFAFRFEDDFGSGYLERFIHGATISWADYIKLPIKYSESSLFIKYLAILLETTSTEKLSKIASRSKWLQKHRALIDFRIARKHGTLSESDILEQSKIADVLYKDQNAWDEKIKIEIDKIKGN